MITEVPGIKPQLKDVSLTIDDMEEKHIQSPLTVEKETDLNPRICHDHDFYHYLYHDLHH